MTGEGDHDDRIGTDGQPGVYRTTHDFGGRRDLSTTVIEAIEDATDIEGPSSRVLADMVDPDCLDGLFRPIRHRTDRDEGTVEFPLSGYRVTVHATGEIVLRPRENGIESANENG